MDETESELYTQMINGEYAYMEYLRKIKIKAFDEETKGYVLDKDHMYYKFYFGSKKITNDEIEIKVELQDEIYQSQLYRKLSLICHPDKCSEKWCHEIFQLVNEANTNNNVKILEELDSHYEKHKSFDKYNSNNLSKIKQINQWKRELWYLWIHDPYIKEIFIDTAKCEERLKNSMENLSTKNNELRKKYNELKKELNTSNV